MRESEKKLWKDLLNADMTSLYYARIAGRNFELDRATKIFLAITASGTVAGWSIWSDSAQYPVFVMLWKVASGLAALTSIALPFLNFSKRVEWASALQSGYAVARNDYELLWIRKSKLSDEELVEELKAITEKEAQLEEYEKHFPKQDDKLLKRCQQDIIKRRNLKHD